MTTEDFNNKYKDYLEEGHYGLDINIPELIEWLDNRFQEFIKEPNFKYFQIKEKFGYGRFYAEGISQEAINEVEDKISLMCKKKLL